MVTRHTAGGLNRRRVIFDAAAGMPTLPPEYPAPVPLAQPGNASTKGPGTRCR